MRCSTACSAVSPSLLREAGDAPPRSSASHTVSYRTMQQSQVGDESPCHDLGAAGIGRETMRQREVNELERLGGGGAVALLDFRAPAARIAG